MTYKLPVKISMARWWKIRFWYPLRRKLKRQYLVESTTLPTPTVVMQKLEALDALIIGAHKDRNDRLAERLQGQKEILRWFINYDR